MTVPKYLISSLILASLLLVGVFATARPMIDTSDCDQFDVKFSLNESSKVILEVSGLKGKQIMHIIGNKGFSKQNITKDDLNNLSRGSYVLIIIDQIDSENHCQKHFEFTIK